MRTYTTMVCSMQLIFLIVCIAHTTAILFPHSGEKWDNLRVRWGNYTAMPLTEQAARTHGFKKISDCGDSSGLYGRRYIKDNDMALILIYDVQGHIAGISAAVSTNRTDGYPSRFLQNHPFVLSGNYYHMSAYFVDPSIICTTGRSTLQYTQQGLGMDLYIQNGTDPLAHSIKMPRKENEISSTHWTLGKCFPSMGVHYWYNTRKDMSCDEFYPVFLMYNGGELNAFGWSLMTGLTSPRVEHPRKAAISGFMNPVPDCIYTAGGLTTLHIYLTDKPEKNLC